MACIYFLALETRINKNHLILRNVFKMTYFFSQIVGVHNALGFVSF